MKLVRRLRRRCLRRVVRGKATGNESRLRCRSRGESGQARPEARLRAPKGKEGEGKSR